MAGWHSVNITRRLFHGRIRYKVKRMESPPKPRLLRYLSVNEVPYSDTVSKSGISEKPICGSFNRIVHKHCCDSNCDDKKRWGKTGLLAEQQNQRRTRDRN